MMIGSVGGVGLCGDEGEMGFERGARAMMWIVRVDDFGAGLA